MLKRLLCLLTIITLAAPFTYSQITSGSLTGVVKEAAGENLKGATIVATHVPSGTRYTTASQSNGQFTINNMRSGGPYSVVITYVGHEQQRYDDIYVQLGEATVLNTNLNKASTTMEQVVVTTTGRNNILNANRTGATTNIGIREIQRMPSITRSINDLTRITPQANGTSVGGGNYRQNFITVDGSDFNNTFGIGTNLPTGLSPISLDALGEISVSVTPYDVRQSGFIGSAVNAVTRSGTNEFAGTVYQYWRSEKQQGNKAGDIIFDRNPFSFNQYGASIGGPIIKNKLFFFINYETDNQPKQVQTRVAASANGAFGSSPNIARPTTSDLDSFSSYLHNKYGYETGPYQGYSTAIERKKFLARIDWNISKNTRLNIRYNQVEGGDPSPVSTSRSGFSAFPGATRTDINAMWYQNSNYFQGANFYSFAAELNSSHGRRISNTLRASYTYQNESRASTSSIFPFVDILKDGLPYVSFGYEPFTYGNLRKVKTHSYVDNFTLNINNHSLTFGLQYDVSTTINGFQPYGTSYYAFNSWTDFVSGNKPVDFGITYSLDPKFQQMFPSFKFNQYSTYLQDEITVNSRFRLSAGIRFDLPGYPQVAEIKTHPLIDSLRFNGEEINTGNLPKSRVMFSPRIAFNWDVNGDRSFQLRGGTGIFTGRVPFVWIVGQSSNSGLLQITSTSSGTANTPGPFNPDPAAYRPSVAPAAGTSVPSTITAIAPNFKFPQTWKTSLAFDEKLGKGFVFSMEGIFNKDINTAIFRNPNLVAPQPLNVTGYPDNRPIYPNATKDKFLYPLTSATASGSNPRPSYPVNTGDPRGTQAFNPIVLDNGSKGYYASLTAKLEKQFSRGWYATVAYTKSLAANMFDGSGDQPLTAFQGTANVNGSNDPGLGYASFVVPDRVIANISYRKEYLKHLATTISLYYEGAIQGRYSYVYSGDINRDGTNFDLMYIPKDPTEISFVSQTVNGVTYTPQQQSDLFFKYMDQDKYLKAHKGQYAERNGAQLPWRNEFDVRVMQDVFVNIGKKRNTIQFTLDIFNFANLLNSNWGLVQVANASAPLVLTNAAALVPGGTVRPTFRLNTDRGHVLADTFRDNVSIASTYYMQFGLRYIFN